MCVYLSKRFAHCRKQALLMVNTFKKGCRLLKGPFTSVWPQFQISQSEPRPHTGFKPNVKLMWRPYLVCFSILLIALSPCHFFVLFTFPTRTSFVHKHVRNFTTSSLDGSYPGHPDDLTFINRNPAPSYLNWVTLTVIRGHIYTQLSLEIVKYDIG